MKNTTGAEYSASKYIELPVRKETTIMDFLLTQMGVSQNKAKDLLSGRAVSVDQKLVTRHDHPLHVGEKVRVSRHKQNSTLLNRFVKIVYEDHDIIVIEKAPGILSMAATAKQYCVKTVLDEYFTKRHFKCRAHVVHRLDRETSGLMMYAKTIEAAQTLEQNWKEMVYDRRYIALLYGKMEQEGGTEESWLKDNKAFITFSSHEDNGGKYAVTHYHRLQYTDRCSLVEMKLETGRKNQIRVHMADLGHPVAGDQKYGNGWNPIGRLALHAYRLHFTHPITGQDMQFETPFPRSFTQFFNKEEESTEE